MRVLLTAATLVVGHFLINCAPAFAQAQGGLLTPAQTRAYHACMTAAWIDDYCRENAWGVFVRYDRTYPACVLANRGRIFPLAGRPFFDADEYCWNQARGPLR
jgi:hypothetical protein